MFAFANVTQVLRSNQTVTLLGSWINRRGFFVFNDTGAIMYIKYGPGCTDSNFSIRITANSLWEDPLDYTGVVTGVWASNGAGQAQVTEVYS